MDRYVTGTMIRKLREDRKMTQTELAERLFVSDKTISKWETGKGLPDITLLEPLAKVLGISTIELLAGENVRNKNRCANILRSKFYVCPVCGNVMYSAGEAIVSCCGITLPPLEAETADPQHEFQLERVEDEWYVTVNHPMTKDHYLSFLAAVSDNGVQMIKLYPEGDAQARFKIDRVKVLYAYCNRHGLFLVRRSDINEAG